MGPMKTIYYKKTDSYHLDYSDELRPYDEILYKVRRAIDEDIEGKVRRALIELGWTPPASGPNDEVLLRHATGEHTIRED